MKRPSASAAASHSGGLFGVPLDALASRRANPPPLIAELDGPSLFGRLASCDALAAALAAAGRAALRQPTEAVVAALDAQGAHASLATALHDVAAPAGDAPALAFAVLLRFLRQLPEPPVPCELYPLVLDAGSGALPALLRKRLPPEHAALIGALGSTLGRLLLRCGLVHGRAATDNPAAAAEQEPALRALTFAFTPALLRPRPDATGPPHDERAAAERTTRHLLLYHHQRTQFRTVALAGTDGEDSAAAASSVGGFGSGSGGRGANGAEAVGPSPPLPSPPAALAAARRAAAAGFVAAGATPSPSYRGSGPTTPSSRSTPGGGGSALLTASTSILKMFEREFGAESFGGADATHEPNQQ